MLDDPFSALDIGTEQRIVRQLKEEFKNQIVIITSHRLSAFEHVDQILVLDQGSVFEVGSHEQLIDHKGLYYEIYQAQKFIKEGSTNA